MDLDDPHVREVFFDIYCNLPRGGPGSDRSTVRALRMCRHLPDEPDVLDVGCGPGQQTVALAKETSGKIIALDNHRPFLARVEELAALNDVADRIRTLHGDMHSLPFEPGSFDLIWCEGAAYIMGFGEACRTWRPLLREGGYLAVTEPCWRKADPPEPVKKFWDEYPPMRDIEGILSTFDENGYEVAGHFVLPDEDWWNDYYTPMQARLPAMRQKYADDPIAQEVIAAAQQEIDVCREYLAYYGYLFVVARR